VDLKRFPGLPEHALTMKDLADAHRLRTHIIGCLETADVTEDPAVKQQLLTFVTVGAGTSKGSLASLGMSKAVADVYGIKLSGTLAWLLWRGFYLSFMPGFQAKLRVGINWLVNSVMPLNIVQIQSTPPATRYIHYRKGDRVFEPGMIIDGFYTVVKGSFRLIIDNPETGEHFEKVFVPGDHFGERVLLRSSLRTGLVVALEDSIVLFIAQKAFTRLARAFPILDAYFKEYIERTFGGHDKAFAPGSINHKAELETLP
jgi:NADH:ubiquinone reductase (H+-translocating)